MSHDLRAYFERIEAAFCCRRGAPLLLSPLDFEKAVEWFAAGIPPEVVEEGISSYFAHMEARKVPLRRAICLSFAEDHVLKAREARRAAEVGRRGGLEEEEGREEDRVVRFLESRAGELEGFPSRPGSFEMPVLSRFAALAASEIRALLPRAAQPLERLEPKLRELDLELGRLVLLESPTDLVASWRQEARERLGDLAAGMEEVALRQTVESFARQSGLKHWGLSRLSLLYL